MSSVMMEQDEQQEAKESPIRLRLVKIDGDTQSREAIDEATVAEYEERYRDGVEMPPIRCVYDGREFWLVDGFHRYHAAKQAGLTALPCITTNGTRETAQWLACAANRTHGLKRTNADKRRAVTLALALRPDESDRGIAEHCGVSHPFVGNVRAAINGESDDDATEGEHGAEVEEPSAKKAKKSKRQPRGEAVELAADDESSEPLDPCDERMQKAEESITEGVGWITNSLAYIRKLAASPEGAWVHLQSIESDLENARTGLRKAAPAGRCAKCGGKGCKVCRKTGWVSILVAHADPKVVDGA